MQTLVSETTVEAINAALLSLKSEIEGLRNRSSATVAADGDISRIASQVSSLSSSVTSLGSSVSALNSLIAGLQGEIAEKQDILTETQLNAVNSGIDAAKVTAYDGYATAIAGKQDALVSGTNIKTLNNTSLLGSGNITIGSTEVIQGSVLDTTGTVTISHSAATSLLGDPNVGVNFAGAFAVKFSYNGGEIVLPASIIRPQSNLYILTCAPNYALSSDVVVNKVDITVLRLIFS